MPAAADLTPPFPARSAPRKARGAAWRDDRRRRRRGGARAAGGPGRGRRRDPQPAAHSGRAQRQQAADAGCPRRALRRDSSDQHGLGRRGADLDHRRAQHPPRQPLGDAPGDAWASASRPTMCWSTGTSFPKGLPCQGEAVIGGDALIALDRRGLDRRQGDARPDVRDHALRGAALRLRLAQGLFGGSAFPALETHGPGRYHRMDFAPCWEAETRRSTGIMVGPLTPRGWTPPEPPAQLELLLASYEAAVTSRSPWRLNRL